ncbi:MAG: protoheme IX farnesyltransferase [Acidimicrobiia bacterium]|nr:protoheme IX farnesyltransferase [Acidimicrobiia bacterium]
MSQVRVTDPRTVASTSDRLKAYLELTKPRIIELLLITTVPAMVVAAGGWPGTGRVLATLVGGTLSAAGANTINQVLDSDIDRVMRRTRRRPLPTGRIDPAPALVFGVTLGVLGFAWLWAASNLLAAIISTVGLLFYVVVYTAYLKRSSIQNIVIGGAAGAVPPLVGWAAVTGTLGLQAWIMFAIVFFWTPPHFWALSLRYRQDYASAAVPMLPVVVGVEATLEHIVRYSVLVVGVSLLPYGVGAAGVLYLIVVAILGVGLVAAALRLRRQPAEAMRFFGWTNMYLAGVFLAMAADVLLST